MKHHCIFEITQPNIYSELYKVSFVDDYGEDYTAADEMCQSMNNLKPKDKFVHFILRCLEQEEFDAVQDFLKTNPHGDVNEVYSPFINSVVVSKYFELLMGKTNIDGWHVFQQCYIATMEERTKLRNAGVLVYIEMLIDGIAVDYPDKNLPCEQLVLLSEVLKKVSLILRECCHQPTESIKTINGKLPNIIKGISFQPIESVKTINGRTERAYHCDNWEIEWRELR